MNSCSRRTLPRCPWIRGDARVQPSLGAYPKPRSRFSPVLTSAPSGSCGAGRRARALWFGTEVGFRSTARSVRLRDVNAFNPRKSRMQRLVKRILVALVILALSGAVYEQVEASKDRRRFPQIGRSEDIGGRSLNIYCVGEGNPTVVLLRGGDSWVLVLTDVGRVIRAGWYVPAGVGWGEPSAGGQPSFFLAGDLHKLLPRGHVTA